jgi:hypothetical protein
MTLASPESQHMPADQPFAHIRHVKKRGFLAAFSQCGNVTRAAEAAGCDRHSHALWLKKDPDYAEAFQEAKAMASDRIEQEIYRRGVEGWDEPVWYEGRQVGMIRRYSDTLLIFLAKGNMPEKYKDRAEHNHTLSPAMAALYAEWQRVRDHPEDANGTQSALEASLADWQPAFVPGLDDEEPGGVGAYDEATHDDYDGKG